MTLHLPSPHLTKLPPTPHWSMPSTLPPPRGQAVAPTPSAGTTARPAAVPAAWGTCEIVLVADRQAGVTHKFFHDWRFEAVLRRGEPEAGAILATQAIAPDRRSVAAGRAPIAVALQFHADAPPFQAPGRETFAWTPLAADDAPDPQQPLVHALARLRQQLGDAGWQAADAAAVCYHKSAPVGPSAGDAPAQDSGSDQAKRVDEGRAGWR
jgi:hypothetical protein